MDYTINTAEQLRPQLQALRKQRGLTQAQLGAALGVTQARIVEIEAAPGRVSLLQLMQVLHALGATLVVRDDRPSPDIKKASIADAPTSGSTGQKRGSW